MSKPLNLLTTMLLLLSFYTLVTAQTWVTGQTTVTLHTTVTPDTRHPKPAIRDVQTRLPPPLKWERLNLSNGLRILLIPDQTQTEIAVEFWVHVGSRDEPRGKYGFAHFFEHATPYGLLKDDAARTAFRSRRTNSNAQTRKDYIRYYVQVRPPDLELALRYIAERMDADTNSILESTTEEHRNNVLNEMARQETNPFSSPKATMARFAATFGDDHPYGHSNYGTVAENRSFTVNEIKDWYTKYFYPKNMILFVSGNFDPKAIEPLLKNTFSKMNRKGSPAMYSGAVHSNTTDEIVVTSKPTLHMLTLTWHIPEWGAKENSALQVLSKILDSRLEHDRPSSITKSGSSELFELYEHAGQFGVFASFASLKDRQQIERHLRESLKKIVKEGVTEAELNAAKTRVIEGVEESQKNLGFIGSRIELLGEGLLYTGDPNFYFQRLKKQKDLSRSELQKVASALLEKAPARVLVIAETKCDDPLLCRQGN